MKINTCILLIIYLIFVTYIELRKKKKRKKVVKVENPRDKHPKFIEQKMYCEGCKAVLTESLNNLYGRKKEADVLNMLPEICDPANYKNKYGIFSNKLY